MNEIDSDTQVIRVNKFIAQQLSIGRRQADEFIERGSVLIDGKTAALGDRINPDTQVVTVRGKRLQRSDQATFIYLALHKPIGYVCSRKQQGDTPTIYSLLPEKYHHLKPVGRLDKDSSGFILLTNDGDFAHRMTHPSFVKIKRYEVSLSQALEPLHRQMIVEHGIELTDGNSQFMLERLHEGDDRQWLVTMHEGKNRQIRRTFASLGYSINKLHRVQFGNYSLGSLEPGNYLEVKL